MELRATGGRLAWAAKDKIVEVLYEGAPLIRRAPRYPVMVLVAIERVVVDEKEPTGLRVYAWAKLVKAWASLRWSDLQTIRPGELRLVEGRLVTTLRRTKTSGPNRRIKEMPLCVSEAAFFENPAWLKVGFELLQWLATFSRDYLLPKLKPNFAVFKKKMAECADVVTVSAAQRAGIPAIAQGFWTERSERAVLPLDKGPEKDPGEMETGRAGKAAGRTGMEDGSGTPSGTGPLQLRPTPIWIRKVGVQNCYLPVWTTMRRTS